MQQTNSLTQTLEQWLPVIDPSRPMSAGAWAVVYGVPAVALILFGWWLTAHAVELGSTLGQWLARDASGSSTKDVEATVNDYDVRRRSKVVAITSRRAAFVLVALLAGASVAAAQDERSRLVLALEIGAVTLQGYDWSSTQKALAGGAKEQNPFVAGIAGHPVAWGAVKVGSMVATVAFADRLMAAKRKKTAIAVLVISNSVMAMVAANNARVNGGRR